MPPSPQKKPAAENSVTGMLKKKDEKTIRKITGIQTYFLKHLLFDK